MFEGKWLNVGIIISENVIKVLFKQFYSTYTLYDNGLFVYLPSQFKCKVKDYKPNNPQLKNYQI